MLILAANGSSSYNLTNSLRFRSSATAYLNRTASASNRKTWTWSGWIKRGTLSTNQAIFTGNSALTANGYFSFYLTTSDTIIIGDYATNWATTTQVFRDPSAWYHIVLAIDTTQVTSTNRMKLYVNGTQVTAFSATSYPALNFDTGVNSAGAHYISTFNASSQPLDGYLSEVNFIDGQALTPSSFGSTDATTGSWIPKKYTGTYGTNGFYLNFADNSALTTASNVGLGKDNSGNGNYFATSGISITAGTTYDSMTDVPTNTSATVANYAVMNPINISGMTLSEANLKVSQTATAQGCRSTIAMTSGKWYWEVTNTTGSVHDGIGIVPDTTALTTDLTTVGSNAILYYAFSGQKYINGTSSAYGATYTTNDIIGIAVDINNNTVTYYKNNTSQGAITGLSLSGSTWYTVNGNGNNISNVKAYNFGQRPFSYTPPTGFVALNTYNLPTSTIVKGNKYMDATTYSGTGANQAITNAGSFKPDFLWLKCRSTAATDHVILDTTRGTSLRLASDTTQADTTQTNNIVSFDTGGFTASTGGDANGSGRTYVAWQWNANGGSTSSNANGTITSTVQANTTAGFSILTYTGNGSAGSTIGHGLGVAPSMIITKRRSAVENWGVYHISMGATKDMFLSLTNAAFTGARCWNNTSPTSSVFTVGTDSAVNTSTVTYVAYCWAEIAGFSKFGSYTGNGSADGTFVYTGFRPKYIMYKRTDSTGSWGIFDTSRNTYNLSTNVLYANLSDAEYTSTGAGFDNIDILSNGFKPRQSNSGVNASGGTYIYMAFAENPFKNSNAR